MALHILTKLKMGNSHQIMPTVDFEKDKNLKAAHMYSKYVEGKNFERAIVAKKVLKKKRIILAASIFTVLSIYTYTILRVKQEIFLDDFEEPPRVVKSQT